MKPATSVSKPRDLVSEFRSGSPEAFTAIYEQHAQRVYGLLTRILGPVDSREDVLQEVFVELFRALPTFRGEARLATFVYRIAVRVAQRHFTRPGNTPRFHPEAIDLCVSPERSPWQKTLDRQELDLVFEVLAGIKHGRRVAFILSAIEGFSNDEVGSVLGISADAAKQRALRGRRDLLRGIDKRKRSLGKKNNQQ